MEAALPPQAARLITITRLRNSAVSFFHKLISFPVLVDLAVIHSTPGTVPGSLHGSSFDSCRRPDGAGCRRSPPAAPSQSTPSSSQGGGQPQLPDEGGQGPHAGQRQRLVAASLRRGNPPDPHRKADKLGQTAPADAPVIHRVQHRQPRSRGCSQCRRPADAPCWWHWKSHCLPSLMTRFSAMVAFPHQVAPGGVVLRVPHGGPQVTERRPASAPPMMSSETFSSSGALK